MRNDAPPDFAELLQDPARLTDLPPEAVPGLLLRVSALLTALSVRAESIGAGNGSGDTDDTLLDVREAAQQLATSEDWLYRHASKLPFTVRLGPRQLRFSARGIERYIRQRQGR